MSPCILGKGQLTNGLRDNMPKTTIGVMALLESARLLGVQPHVGPYDLSPNVPAILMTEVQWPTFLPKPDEGDEHIMVVTLAYEEQSEAVLLEIIGPNHEFAARRELFNLHEPDQPRQLALVEAIQRHLPAMWEELDLYSVLGREYLLIGNIRYRLI